MAGLQAVCVKPAVGLGTMASRSNSPTPIAGGSPPVAGRCNNVPDVPPLLLDLTCPRALIIAGSDTSGIKARPAASSFSASTGRWRGHSSTAGVHDEWPASASPRRRSCPALRAASAPGIHAGMRLGLGTPSALALSVLLPVPFVQSAAGPCKKTFCSGRGNGENYCC